MWNKKFITLTNKEVVVFNKGLTRRSYFGLPDDHTLNDDHTVGHLTYFIHINIIHRQNFKSLSVIKGEVHLKFCAELIFDFSLFKILIYFA